MKWLRELRRYPSAIVGMVILVIFVLFAIYALIAIPYDQAVYLWRGSGPWLESPMRAAPLYYDWFTRDKLPRTFIITLEDEGVTVTEEMLGGGMKQLTIVLPFDYDYDGFPSELQLYQDWQFETGQRPSVYLTWKKPDGQIIPLHPTQEKLPRDSFPAYYISQDRALERVLGEVAFPDVRDPILSPHMGLLARDLDVGSLADIKPLHGRYEMVMQCVMEQGVELREVRLRVYGQIHGWAGTDHQRRELIVALLWGAPIGLAFGLLAAVGAQLSTFVLGGIGTWMGGKVDAVFRRLTELTMVLPSLAILIMIAHFYEPSIWRILGIVILLNIFSASYMVYRSIILQTKESPYIEAAQAYGAGGFRIIFRYILPRLAPMLLPQFVIVVPAFVFLEASLALLGLGDPMLPTWGKVLQDSQNQGALLTGHYYWLFQPGLMLMFIGFGFAMVGYSLDRIVNPKLRSL